MHGAYHAAILLILAIGLHPSAAPAGPPPQRVVSLSPFATQVVRDLGAESRLVAVDGHSARLWGAGAPPVTTAASALEREPSLLLLPGDAPPLPEGTAGVVALRMHAHEIDEQTELVRAIGAALGLPDAAHRLLREQTRPLAKLGALSFGARRPRVAAVVSVVPLRIAGDHSFATDVIELAGGESVSHGEEERSRVWAREELTRARPELLVLVGALSAERERDARAALGSLAPIHPLPLGEGPIPFDELLEAARALRTALESLDPARN